jgi:hypothetical protein
MAAPDIHRNLLWISADPRALDLLLADPQLRDLVVARPFPGVAAARGADRARLEARLAKLGQVPRIAEGA